MVKDFSSHATRLLTRRVSNPGHGWCPTRVPTQTGLTMCNATGSAIVRVTSTSIGSRGHVPGSFVLIKFDRRDAHSDELFSAFLGNLKEHLIHSIFSLVRNE